MFIDLVDVLRCPNSHEETWLVLAAERIDGRYVFDGVLGCPVCKTEFPIIAGVARLDRGNPRRTGSLPPDENEAVRLAALLNLSDPRGFAILIGATGSHASKLRELTEVQLLLVDPPSGVEMGAGVSGLTTDREVAAHPLAYESARAIAFDEETTAEALESRLGVVSVGARILASVSLPLPASVRELARDDRHWLGAREPTSRTSGTVSIGRGTRGRASSSRPSE
jgi:uncharacterized protein YbaR (Trm112 family)